MTCMRRLLMLLSMACPLAVAQPPAFEVRLQSCLQMSADAERLRCLEAAARQYLAGRPEGGDSGNGVTVAPGADRAEAKPPPESVSSSIERVERRPRGQRILYLANGQVWTELQRGRGQFRSGLRVEIERTFTGGYLLSTESGLVTRVRQVD